MEEDDDEVTAAVHEYVGVVYREDNKPNSGEVLEIDDDDESVHIDFMESYVKEKSAMQNFRCPQRSDDMWVNILCVISEPEEGKRGYHVCPRMFVTIFCICIHFG